MPISAGFANFLSAGYTAETAGPHGPPPTPRITNNGFYKIDDVVTPTINLILGRGSSAVVSEPSSDLRDYAKKVLDVNAQRREARKRREGDSPFKKNGADDLPFLRTLSRPESAVADSKRPFVRIMFHDDVETQGYLLVKGTAEGMLNGGTKPEDFDIQLWLGYLTWHSSTITAWGRAKTLLAALYYRKDVYVRRATNDQLKATRAGQASHSLAHLPSLTARQARRSGVEQEELRERWA